MRFIPPCFVTGQAAGAAAALAAQQGVQPRHIALEDLRASLIRQDVYLGESDSETPTAPGEAEEPPLRVQDDG